MTQCQLNYTDVDGRPLRIFIPLLVGAFAAGPLLLLFRWVTNLPSATLPVALLGLGLIPTTWLMTWLALRLAVLSWRSGRGTWWLRLSDKGFEVNDRLFRPRRYSWREIDKFMLVALSGQVEHAVVAPGVTFTEAAKNDGAQPPSFRVGFSYAPGHRRSLPRALFGGLRGRDGTKADGIVMGYWNRPFDESVDLMNQWLVRYRAA